MAATGKDNPRGGTVSVHTKARMWDRLMVEAAVHGGLRALTYGDGTLIVYDPVLTAEEADTALPEWLTGHPAVTSYPLKPRHAHPQTIADTRKTIVHRLPGAQNHERAEYDASSLAPLRSGGAAVRQCRWYSTCKAPVSRYLMQTDTYQDTVLLCDFHAGMARTFLRAIGAKLGDKLPD